MIRLTAATSHRFYDKALMLILVVSLSLLAACGSNAGSPQTGGSSSNQVSAGTAPTARPLATATSLQITGAPAVAPGDVKKSAVEDGAKLSRPRRINPVCSSAHLNRLSKANLDRQTSLMQQAGIQWVRFDFVWFDMEPSPNVYSFSKYDAIVNNTTAHNIKVIALVPQYGIPPFYRQDSTNSMSPPANPSDYGRFAKALAAHFKGKIRLYELGNEPNANWGTQPNVAQYTALLKAGYQGVKAGDSTAKVISGGLANIRANDFLVGMYQNGAKGFFDYLGFHPYSWPSSPDDTMNATNFAVTAILRRTMLHFGDNKQIMSTEVGWPTFSGGVDEQTQATYISRVYQKVEYEDYKYVSIACIYDFVNDGADTTNAEDNFGLLRFDYTQKLGYATMSAARRDYNTHFTPTNP
jgi:hypothetical protein